MIDIEDTRRDHIRYLNELWGGYYCQADNQKWPCRMTEALDEIEQLREALADAALTWHRGIVHLSEPPFTLEACKYERCRRADTLIGKPL